MLRRTSTSLVGVSAIGCYAPPAKVCLKDWCGWGGANWDKVSDVVGHSFRVCADNENAYTMAATAVIRLIVNNDVDPTRVGMLGLGTESSTDNAAGAVIVRGMVDHGLEALGLPRLSRFCEVPEFKHACLGGVYAIKNACRYSLTDGHDRLAIAVSSDIAEYQRGSTGEQTQGAGAIAMLVERTPKMFELDLMKSGSASAYRGPDFRKPVKRHFVEGYGSVQPGAGGKIADFPVFSGPYSTVAYQDEVTQAVENMLGKLHANSGEFYAKTTALFFHRPYNMMPIQAMSCLYARALARANSAENQARFVALCAAAKVKPEDVQAELSQSPDFFKFILKNEIPNVSKNTDAVAKVLRRDKEFMAMLQEKMSLGSGAMMNFGNLYSASLPAWIAAGFEEAHTKGLNIDGKPMVIVGYGSGDASEAIPMMPVTGWQKAASKIGVQKALENAVTLTKEQYEGIHSGAIKEDIGVAMRRQEFVVDRIGSRHEAAFQDLGIEYYKFIQ